MAESPQDWARFSDSAKRALRLAWTAALHRTAGEPDAEVEPPDLLVGVLLAHPDRNGEGRVLLSHFGLTGRDALPPTYPVLSLDDLRRWAEQTGADRLPPLSGDAEQVARQAQANARGDVELRYLLGALLATPTEVERRLDSALAASGTALTLVGDAYFRWLRGFETSGRSSEASSDPSSGAPRRPRTTAGQDLREFLRRELPQRPVDIPTYTSDRVDGGTDLVGIRAEVDAFAYLLASRALRPPLAVGLFGDWGSGKSFLMSSLKNRIGLIGDQIKNEAQTTVPFWKNIRQIEFNAWEYVQGNLWASILDHIFRELGDEHTVGFTKRRRDEVSDELGGVRSVVVAQRVARQKRENAVKRYEGELRSAEEKRDEELKKLEGEHQEVLDRTLDAAARQAVEKVLGKQRSGASGNVDELVDALTEARDEIKRGRALLGSYWNPRHISLATLGAAAVPIVALVVESLGAPALVSVLAGVTAAVPGVTALLRNATSWSRAQLDEIERVRAEVESEYESKKAEVSAPVDEAQTKLEGARAELETARTEQRNAEARVQTLQKRLEELTAERILGEFLAERSRSTDYRQHLGLLSIVREDLGNLEELVRTNNEAVVKGEPDKGRVNRVVLYIDDLDRCPPAKVVEVLEAVHLLLAFELFVVVVAVDARWLSSALTTQLPALSDEGATSGHPTPNDYLEKIFQLPFCVRPLGEPGRTALVHGLLESSVSEGGGGQATSTNGADLRVGDREEEVLRAMLSRKSIDPRLEAHQLALTGEDLAFAESLAPLLGDTPRRVKRFVNVFQLLMTMSTQAGADAQMPSERAVVAFLAAVHDGLPSMGRTLLARLAEGTSDPLSTIVTSIPSDGAAGERTRLQHWLEKYPDWNAVRGERFRPWVDLVRRVSFDEDGDAPTAIGTQNAVAAAPAG